MKNLNPLRHLNTLRFGSIKLLWLLFHLAICTQSNLFAQPFYHPPCGESSDYPPGCHLCGPIYIGSTRGFTPDTVSYDFSCGNIENSQWLSFTSYSTDVSITILATNCLNDKGVELGLYDINLNQLGTCFSSNNGNVPGNISASGLIPGDVYFIMVDGKDGDICEFTLTKTGGGPTAPPPSPPYIRAYPDKEEYCPGEIVRYRVFHDFPTSFHEWETPSNGLILSGEGTRSIEVLWSATGSGFVEVNSSNICYIGPPVFEPFSVAEIQPTTITIESCIDSAYGRQETFPSAGGCDSLVIYNYVPYRKNINKLDTTICPGSEIVFHGNAYAEEGNYTIVLPGEDANGCDSIIDLTLQFYPVSVNIDPSGPFQCGGDTIILTSIGSSQGSQYAFQWTTGNYGHIIGIDTQQQVAVDKPGKYFLTVSLNDANGNAICTVIDSVLVGASSFPIATWNIAPEEACINEPVTFAVPTDPTFLDYNWSTNGKANIEAAQETATFYFAEAGDYEICVSAMDSCGWTDSLCKTITVYAEPRSEFNLPSNICSGETFTLRLDSNPDPTIQYEWEINGPTGDFRIAGPGPFDFDFELPGEYQVTLIAQNGVCVNSTTLKQVNTFETLESPSPTCHPVDTFIFVEWPSIPDALGYNIWVNGQLTSEEQTRPDYLISNLNPGDSVFLRVEAIGAYSCQTSSSRISCQSLLCDNPNLLLPVRAVCKNGNTSSLIQYFGCDWIGPALSSEPCRFFTDSLAPGQYIFKNQFRYEGCTDTALQIINLGHPFSASYDVTQPVFLGGNASIQVSFDTLIGGEQILWETGDTARVLNNLAPGHYCAEITRNGNCRLRPCFTINSSDYQVPSLVVVCPNRTKEIQVKPDSSIALQWFPSNGLSCADCANPTIKVSNSTIYTLIGETDDGRKDTTGVFVLVLPEVLCGFFKEESPNDILENLLGSNFTAMSYDEIDVELKSIANELVEESVLVFPNPGNGVFHFKTTFPVQKINLINALGQQFEVKLSGNQEGTFSVEGFTNGMYKARFLGDGISISKTIIKE